MPFDRQGHHRLLRLAVFLAAAACVALVDRLPPPDLSLQIALGGLFGVLLAGALIPSRRRLPTVQLSFLALELVALGGLGVTLARTGIVGVDGRLPFASGYLVAILVAVVGARLGASILGALAGAMVLGTGTVFSMPVGALPQAAPAVAQVGLILITCLHTAVIAGGVRRATRSRELTRQVDREMKVREAASAELVSFAMALADSPTLAEMGEAVLRHLRCHTELQARGVVLESEGEDVALWEEAGRLDPEQIERRRVRLQESLARAGSNFLIRRLTCHTTSLQPAAHKLDFRTAVDIPIRVGGRVAGVLLIADAGSGRLPPDRISVLVDVARRTSEAISRHERLRGHEQRRTSMLLRQMREGVLLLGTDGQVQLANPAARQVIAACAAEDADPEALPRIGELTLDELVRTPPGVSRRFRATFVPSGQDHPTQLACSALSVLDRGRRIGTLVTLADITDEEISRRRIEQAEKMTLVGQTLAGVAHELNNPLAALIGYADLLGTMEIPAEIEKPVTQMKEQALRSTRIVRNLLNFARRRNPERVPTSLAELVHGTVELFAYEARMADVEVALDLPDELPRVLADQHSLQQVLVNLVQNALHALSGWEGERRLEIRAHTSAEGVVLSVTDTGPGVPDELRTQVFESFFTTKGPSKGTGLGLALSRSIAQEHGGDLILAPDVGQGASFSMRLPPHDPTRTEVRQPEIPEGLPADAVPRTILVVDDEVSVRETLVAQLGHLGSSVDSASNVTEAQRLISENRYEALVVDIRMPGSSGFDLHSSLAENNPALAQRVVFITGDFVNDDVLNRAMETGRVVLEKPFTLKELTAALIKTTQGSNGLNGAGGATTITA